jgi:hypothetical protein
MGKIKYITVEYGRAYETFMLLHGMYTEIFKTKIETDNEEEEKIKDAALKQLDELLLYYAVRLHINWTSVKDKIKDQDQTKEETEGENLNG